MKTPVVVVGAGAIGRGFLPWAIDPARHSLVVIDSNRQLVDRLRTRLAFTTHRVEGDRYVSRQVEIEAAYTPDEFSLARHPSAVAAFFSVGPRNVARAAVPFRGSDIPLILCENEPETVADAKRIVGHDRVYFAVPDVITSNTAAPQHLQADPLAITTESGVLFVEQGAQGLFGDITFLSQDDLLRKQWTAKLYLHNTPHCIAAYLGALAGATYVHEALAVPAISAIVEGAMTEMLQVLKLQWDIDHAFLDWYAEKELARFRCALLFDPVARVAREPLRKLEAHGRLVGAAQLCLTAGVVPNALLRGIVAAVLFDDANDPDHYIGMLRETLDSASFNRYILGLRAQEPLDLMLRRRFTPISRELQACVAPGRP